MKNQVQGPAASLETSTPNLPRFWCRTLQPRGARNPPHWATKTTFSSWSAMAGEPSGSSARSNPCAAGPTPAPSRPSPGPAPPRRRPHHPGRLAGTGPCAAARRKELVSMYGTSAIGPVAVQQRIHGHQDAAAVLVAQPPELILRREACPSRLLRLQPDEPRDRLHLRSLKHVSQGVNPASPCARSGLRSRRALDPGELRPVRGAAAAARPPPSSIRRLSAELAVPGPRCRDRPSRAWPPPPFGATLRAGWAWRRAVHQIGSGMRPGT